MPKTVATKVAGRKIRVTKAIVRIAAESFWADWERATVARESFCVTRLRA